MSQEALVRADSRRAIGDSSAMPSCSRALVRSIALALIAACDPTAPKAEETAAPAGRAPASEAAPAPREAPSAASAPVVAQTEARAEAPAAAACELHEPGSAQATAISRVVSPQTASRRYRPTLLDQAPAKASIQPGEYLCKISREYKLRPCSVTIDAAGHTILQAPLGLIAIEGVLYDEGEELRFDGWPMEPRPFGCFSCDERCTIDPSSCVCTELPAAASAHCVAQPITFSLKRGKAGWKGSLRWGSYYSRYEGAPPGRRQVGYEIEPLTMIVELRSP
jgi:hypothetical protein